MGNNRVPRSVSLAIEAARASLAQITCPVDLSGTWQHFDWELVSPPGIYLVNLKVRIHGVDQLVKVTCDSSSVSHNPYEGTGWTDCYVVLDASIGLNWHYRCMPAGNRIQAIHQKRYSDADINWLKHRATEIRAHERFAEFQEFSPHAAQVLIEGGRTYGVSLDAAVAEFEKYLTVI